MYALSCTDKNLSPFVMRFQQFWIFDLRSCSDFWKRKVHNDPEVITHPHTWGLLLDVYGLQRFSPLAEAQHFAKDYFSFFHPSLSPQQQKKVFSQLERLGVLRIGQLAKLPPAQITRRWGKHWSQFLMGLNLSPQATWPWIRYQRAHTITLQHIFDFSVTQSDLLLAKCLELVESATQGRDSLHFKRLTFDFISENSSDDQKLELLFHSQPRLSQSQSWIERLLSLRLHDLRFLSPITGLNLEIEPSPPPQAHQLSLFQSPQSQLNFNRLLEKLKFIGATAFQPQIVAHVFPEDAWVKAPPKNNFEPQDFVRNRPLIIYDPSPLPPPDFPLHPLERVESFSKDGRRQSRDYFGGFMRGQWHWIFRDESKSWFDQGILE